MPALFVGHGSPMNAIEENASSRKWQNLGKSLPRPQVILCISAHWETKGTFFTAMEKPKTIHDFGGFPKALFDTQYPAPGYPELGGELKTLVKPNQINPDKEWGLDHGAWSVLNQMYPKADIPVVQLSLDYTKDPAYHYPLGKELRELRNKGVLIIGSGNIVHNLGMLAWQQPETGYDWAIELNQIFKSKIELGNHQDLIQYQKLSGKPGLAIPTPEHYLPLLYVLALQEKNEKPHFFNDFLQMGSISMTSVLFGDGL
jgi:4,5-DOPA dioxygenase extradiol